MADLKNVKEAVLNGKTKLIQGFVQEALEGNAAASEILQCMIDAMGEVGDKFSKGEIFVPEMLMAAKTMKNGVEILSPIFAKEGSETIGKCIIGTVAGDLHDIGKNLVATMIGSAGFEIIDLGVDVPAEKFIDAIKANPDVKVVALSALLTTTMPSLKETTAAIKNSGLQGFKTIVGGAPITQEFADSIGADAYAKDAGSAAVKAKELVM